MTDEPCAACGHAERHHDPEDRNCEQHAERGMGRCWCKYFIGHNNPDTEDAVAAAVAAERAAVVTYLTGENEARCRFISDEVAMRIESGEYRREENE